MTPPKPVVFGDTALPSDVKHLTRVLTADVMDFYESRNDGPERLYVILNSLAIVAATVIAGPADLEAARWFLEALDRNVRALFEANNPPPPGTTKQ